MPSVASAVSLRSARSRAPQQVANELRRNEIVRAAVRVFGRKGYAAARAEDIAQAARIAKGTLYLYFKSKEAIYAAAVEHSIAELEALMAERFAAAYTLRERLEVVVGVRLLFWLEHEAIYRMILTVGREPRHRRQTNELMRRGHEGIVEVFRQAVTAGEIREGDFQALGWAIMDLVRGTNERRLNKLADTTPEQDVAWIVNMALAMCQNSASAGTAVVVPA